MHTAPKILVVDDRPANLISLTRMIEPLGADVVTADSGTGCLAAVLEHEFALILLDVEMPGMDGFETADLLRGDEAYRDIPIIFVTARDGDDQDLFRGYASGAVDFMRKPVRQGILTSKVKIFLRMYEQRMEIEASRTAFAEFAHMASHDLRAPLRQMKAFTELVLRSGEATIPDREQSHLRRVISAAERMERLMESLLGYARMGTKTVPMGECGLAEVMEEVLADHQSALTKSRGEVVFGALEFVRGDRSLLYQLFQNLIGNAVKYRKPDVAPLIRVSAKRVGAFVEVIVADNGIGISPADGERMFEPFQRLVGASEYEGAGIGLATTKKIVEAHDGSISATGELGVGTTVTVVLLAGAEAAGPRAEDQENDGCIDDQAPLAPASEARPIALVVDDSDLDRELAVEALSPYFDIESTDSAEGGLRRLAEGGVQVVVSDYQMPQRDGLSFLQEVQRRYPEVRRIMMSSMSRDVVESAEGSAAVEAFFEKDITLDSVLEALREPRPDRAA